jgi:hypothetical protein
MEFNNESIHDRKKERRNEDRKPRLRAAIAP